MDDKVKSFIRESYSKVISKAIEKTDPSGQMITYEQRNGCIVKLK